MIPEKGVVIGTKIGTKGGTAAGGLDLDLLETAIDAGPAPGRTEVVEEEANIQINVRGRGTKYANEGAERTRGSTREKENHS